MTLLIADDSAGFRERTRKLLLNHSNVQIIDECSNGAEAMAIISEKKPDMVILDIRMPIMNGIQVLKQLKQQGTLIKKCVLTNYPYPQFKNKCMALGADYYLNKSDDFDKLNSVIENY